MTKYFYSFLLLMNVIFYYSFSYSNEKIESAEELYQKITSTSSFKCEFSGAYDSNGNAVELDFFSPPYINIQFYDLNPDTGKYNLEFLFYYKFRPKFLSCHPYKRKTIETSLPFSKIEAQTLVYLLENDTELQHIKIKEINIPKSSMLNVQISYQFIKKNLTLETDIEFEHLTFNCTLN